MRIGVHAGHNPRGKVACGAVGLICESTESRKVKDEVIMLLKESGHTVYDFTVENGTSQNDIVNKQIKQSNAKTLDLTVAIHFNSGRNDKNGDGDNAGVEVLMTSIDGIKKEIGDRICKNISKLGFDNRGNKVYKKSGFLNKTKSKAILVECCFVDDADDVKLYNYKTMAKAIAEGIHGSTINIVSNVNHATSTSTTNTKYRIKTGGFSKEVIEEKVNHLKGLTGWWLTTQEQADGSYCILTGGFDKDQAEKELQALIELTGWWATVEEDR